MRKIFTTIACVAMMGLSSLSAFADAELGQAFTLSTETGALAFTAPETGTLTAVISPGISKMFGDPASILCADANGNSPLTMTVEQSNSNYATTVSWEVTQNVTYYFVVDLFNNNITVILSMDGGADLPTPDSDVELNKQFTAQVNTPLAYYNEKDGKLKATISPGFQNWTAKAGMLFLNPDDFIGPSPTFDPATSGLGNIRTITWEVKAGTLYYILATETTGEQIMTLSFEEDTTGGDQGGDNNPDPSNWTLIDWDTQTTVLSGTTYYVVGQGGAAYIEVPRTSDYTVGNQLAMYYNGDTSDPVDLTPALTSEGYYYYNINYLADGVNYTLVSNVFGNSGIPVTFKSGTYKPATQTITYCVDENFNAQQVYAFTAPESGVVEFVTQTDASYFDNPIWFSDEACETAITVKKIEDSTVYAVTFDVVEGETYYLYFTYPNYIIATLAMTEIEPTPDYMSGLPTFYYDADPAMPTVILYWNETIQAIDENTPLQGTLTSPGGAPITVTLAITTWYPEADNDPDTAGSSAALAPNNALIASLGEIIPVYGVGIYTFSIGSIVMNADEEWNMPVDGEQFTVTAGPSVTTIEPTYSISGDSIIISWDEETVEVYNPNGADIILMSVGENEEPAEYRLSVGNGVTIVDNSVVIDLTTLDLVEGESYMLMIPEYYFYIGGTSTVNGDIMKEFLAEASGVNVIGNVEGEQVIYNLNGVRVDKNAKGLLIINGKKVLVK